jgi:hypothetical protein
VKLRLLAAAALAFGLLASPHADAAKKGKSRAPGPSFPMKSDEYKKLVEGRIDKVREIIDRKLDRTGVSPDRKKAIHKLIDDEAKDIRAEVVKACADGTVTEGEAGKIKTLTTGLRARVRERMRAEKNPAAKAILDRQKAKAEQEKADKEKGAKAAKEKAAKEAAVAKDAAAKGDAAAKVKAAKEKAAKEAAVKQKAVKSAVAKQKAAEKPKAGPTKQAKAKGAKKKKAKKAAGAEAEAL